MFKTLLACVFGFYTLVAFSSDIKFNNDLSFISDVKSLSFYFSRVSDKNFRNEVVTDFNHYLNAEEKQLIKFKDFSALEKKGLDLLKTHTNELDISAFLLLVTSYSIEGNSLKIHRLLGFLEHLMDDLRFPLDEKLSFLSSLLSATFYFLEPEVFKSLYNDFLNRIQEWQDYSLSVIYVLNISYRLGFKDFLTWGLRRIIDSEYAVLSAVGFLDLSFYQEKDVKRSLRFMKENLYKFSPVNLELFFIYLDIIRTNEQFLGKILTHSDLEFLIRLADNLSEKSPLLLLYLADVFEFLNESDLLLRTLGLMEKYPRFSDLAPFISAKLFESQGKNAGALAFYKKIKNEPYLFEAQQKILLFSNVAADEISIEIEGLLKRYPHIKQDRFLMIEALMWYKKYQYYTALSVLKKLSDGVKSQPFTLSLMGKIFMKIGDVRACDYFRKAIIEDEKRKADQFTRYNVSYKSHLGYCLLESSLTVTQEIIDLIKAAYKKQPKHSTYITNYGWVLFKQNKYSQAVDILLKGLAEAYNEEQAVKSGTALVHVLNVIGQREKALKILKGIIKEYPENPRLLSVLSLLKL